MKHKQLTKPASSRHSAPAPRARELPTSPIFSTVVIIVCEDDAGFAVDPNMRRNISMAPAPSAGPSARGRGGGQAQANDEQAFNSGELGAEPLPSRAASGLGALRLRRGAGWAAAGTRPGSLCARERVAAAPRGEVLLASCAA